MNHGVNQISRWTAFSNMWLPYTATTSWALNLPKCFANSKEDRANVNAICTLILHRHADMAQCQKMDLVTKRLKTRKSNLSFH